MTTTKSKRNRLDVYKTFKLYIGGAFPRTESGRYLREETPEGDFVANICHASRKDFRDAMEVARKAQSGWASRTPFNRSQIFHRMAEMMESRRGGLEQALVERAGYDEASAQEELDCAIDRLLWYGGWADKFVQVFGSTNPVASAHFNFTMPEPTGVVTCLAPKSAPILGLVTAMAPIIVSGNTAVIVVDHDSRSIAMDLAEVLHCSDLPGGVVNILTGFRDELRDHIAGHRDLDGIAIFDGGVEERREIETTGAESVKRVHSYEAPEGEGWRSDDAQSPYWIMPFVEFKTAWHPMGY